LLANLVDGSVSHNRKIMAYKGHEQLVDLFSGRGRKKLAGIV
jgi:hypothetical protein